ncbi:MAG: MFS transporter [candidate division KSB1 bacterium]|nr:MFS transporter [candidate division KSB1 bacterium]MDZ7275587.1 MFS transporter [candidate division KSB1 bacterium]MDZ7284722.1 MFS transporter [candidate division KSB1 bacterium]MDZ7297859.1 MFS transporter [candidate division KSB1 bacterium]MDZ7309556.1 MFS transporter [candidate division KSB1 bacterium]
MFFADQSRPVVLVTLAIFLQVLLAALDTTIVSTAMPTVVAALGGLHLYSSVFSVYMIASTIATPIAGKLSDQFNRKRMYLASLFAFLVTSMLCGAAPGMIWLIVGRALQGLAGGTMFAISLSLVAVLYAPHERGRIQGIISSLWAIASMIGPPLGGYVVQHLSWRWAFYLNLPVGILAMVFVHRFLREPALAGKQTTIDYAGAALLTTVVAGVMVVSNNLQVFSRLALLLVGALLVLLLLVLLHIERRAAAPILPLALLRQREIAAANLTTFLTSVCTFGFIVFAPLFVQGVLSGTATQAGLVLIPLSIGWGGGSFLSAHFLNRLGYRPVAVLGAVLMLIGFGYLNFTTHMPALAGIAAVGCLIGIGMGLATNVVTVAVQNSAPSEHLGAATSSTIFARALGGALGVSILGAILAGRVAALLGDTTAGGVNDGLAEIRTLLLPETRAQLPPQAYAHLQLGLAAGLHAVFAACAVLTLAAFFVSLRVSTQRPYTDSKTLPATVR